jgi:hypothetical protein
VNHINAKITVTTNAPEKNWAGLFLAKLKIVLIMFSCFDDRVNLQRFPETKKFF